MKRVRRSETTLRFLGRPRSVLGDARLTSETRAFSFVSRDSSDHSKAPSRGFRLETARFLGDFLEPKRVATVREREDRAASSRATSPRTQRLHDAPATATNPQHA
jgi:hypothetical protein